MDNVDLEKPKEKLQENLQTKLKLSIKPEVVQDLNLEIPEIGITANLHNAYVNINGCIVGEVYGDVKNRWKDGKAIITSKVITWLPEGKLTTSGNIYKIKSWISHEDYIYYLKASFTRVYRSYE